MIQILYFIIVNSLSSFLVFIFGSWFFQSNSFLYKFYFSELIFSGLIMPTTIKFGYHIYLEIIIIIIILSKFLIIFYFGSNYLFVWELGVILESFSYKNYGFSKVLEVILTILF